MVVVDSTAVAATVAVATVAAATVAAAEEVPAEADMEEVAEVVAVDSSTLHSSLGRSSTRAASNL